MSCDLYMRSAAISMRRIVTMSRKAFWTCQAPPHMQPQIELLPEHRQTETCTSALAQNRQPRDDCGDAGTQIPLPWSSLPSWWRGRRSCKSRTARTQSAQPNRISCNPNRVSLLSSPPPSPCVVSLLISNRHLSSIPSSPLHILFASVSPLKSALTPHRSLAAAKETADMHSPRRMNTQTNPTTKTA